MSAPVDVLAVRAAQLREAEEAARDAEYRYAYARTRRDREEADSDMAYHKGCIAHLKYEIARLKEELAAPRIGDDPKNRAALRAVSGEVRHG